MRGYTNNCGQWAPERYIQHNVAARVIRDSDLLVTTEVNRRDFCDWFHTPGFSGGFSIDLIIYDPAANGILAAAEVRALVELKKTIWNVRDDIRRTSRLCSGFEQPVFGYVIACSSYAREDWHEMELEEARRLATELGLAPPTLRVFEDQVDDDRHYGAVIGLKVTSH